MWEYRAVCKEVIDGDTIDLRLDLGFYTYKHIRVRLAGVDTAETYGVPEESDEYKRGMAQKEFVKDFLDTDTKWELTFVSLERSGKFGRWLGDIYINNEYVTEALISEWPEVER